MEEKQRFISQQDVKLVAAMIAFFVPLFLCYADITKQLALIQQSLMTIKSNDLAHIEIEMTDLKARNVTADDRQRNIEMAVTGIQTALNLANSNLNTYNSKNTK